MTFSLYDVFGNRLLVAVTDAADAELRQSSRLAGFCLARGRRIADGIALFSQRSEFLRTAFYNPDGSFERLCGNSLLVAAAALLDVEQAAIVRPFDLPPIELFRSAAYLEASSVVEAGPRAVELHGIGRVPVYDTGSPHAVVRASSAELELDGAAAAFVRDANVNLTLVKSAGGVLHARTLERGVGAETAACGTGALAVALAAERFGEWIEVRYESGSYRILVRRSDRGMAWTLRTDPSAVDLVERRFEAHDEAGPSSVSGSSSTRCST